MNGHHWASTLVSAFKAESPGLIAIARVIASGLALAGAPLIARGIGPDGRGQTSAAMAAFYLVPIILGLGVPTEARRLAAISDVGQVVSAARRFCALLLLPSILVAWLLCATVLAELPLEVRWVAFIGLALAPAYVGILTSESILIATGRFRHVLALIVIPPTFMFVWVVALFLSHRMTAALVLAGAVVGAASAAVHGFLVTRHHVTRATNPRPRLMSGSMKFAGSAIAEAASNRLDQLIAVAVIGAHQAGLYAVAVTVSVLILPLAHSFSAATFTRIATMDGDARRDLEAETLRVTALGCLALVLGLVATVPLLVPLIFGRDFEAATGPTLVLLIGGWLGCLAYVASMILAAEGRGLQLTAIQVAGLVVGLTLFLWLGPRWGAWGASLASTLGSLVVLTLLGKALSLGARRFFPQRSDLKQVRVRFLKAASDAS